jgi:hypothetical protein
VGRVDAGSFCRFRPWAEVEDNLHVRKEKRTTWAVLLFVFFIRKIDTSWLSCFGRLDVVCPIVFFILLPSTLFSILFLSDLRFRTKLKQNPENSSKNKIVILDCTKGISNPFIIK